MQTQDEKQEEIDQEAVEESEEFLTFRLGQEEYAVSIMRVKEIRAWEPVTRVPHAKPWECGLINVRGAIVPIIDLRKRIGLADLTYTKHTVVIMFGLENAGRERVQGAVVDALTDVARLLPSQVQPSPQLNRGRQVHFAQGVVEHEGRMIVMLDLLKALDAG